MKVFFGVGDCGPVVQFPSFCEKEHRVLTNMLTMVPTVDYYLSNIQLEDYWCWLVFFSFYIFSCVVLMSFYNCSHMFVCVPFFCHWFWVISYRGHKPPGKKITRTCLPETEQRKNRQPRYSEVNWMGHFHLCILGSALGIFQLSKRTLERKRHQSYITI